MTHIGIQRLRTGRGKEYAAEYHKADLIIGAVEHFYRVDRVKGPQNRGKVKDMQQSGDAEEAEPQKHNGTEGLADAARSGALNEKQRYDYNKREHDDAGLPHAEEVVHALDGA